MGRKTKKVGSTGRFGARYGAKLRRRVLDIEKRRADPQRCPSCATRALTRKAVGLWNCKKCGLSFAGGAYVPFTDAGKAANVKMICVASGLAQKQTLYEHHPDILVENTEELIKLFSI